jgi:hypothetical protein
MAGNLMTAQKKGKMPITVTEPTTLFCYIFSAMLFVVGRNEFYLMIGTLLLFYDILQGHTIVS